MIPPSKRAKVYTIAKGALVDVSRVAAQSATRLRSEPLKEDIMSAKLVSQLRGFASQNPESSGVVERFLDLLSRREDALFRTCEEGHITASVWIVSPTHDEVLLTLHAKLGRWLQLGGHVDGEADVLLAALREAEEESGMTGFKVLSDHILDVDIHPIPARAFESEHLHYDVRFLLEAPAGQELVISNESTDLKWWPWSVLAEIADEESLLRMAREARRMLRLEPPR